MSLVRIQSPRPLIPSPMIAVPIRYRRAQRGLFIQKLQHAVPSIVVLGNGLEHLSHEPHGLDLWVGVAEIGVSLLVIGSVIRGFRKLRSETAANVDVHHAHHGIDWIDICLGAMLSVEAYAVYHANGHIARPTILLAVTMFTIGLLHGKLTAKGDEQRALRVTADGISMPKRLPFSRMTLAWAEIAAIEIGERYAMVSAIDGRAQRIDLHDVLNPKAVRDALVAATTQLGEHHAANASIESTAPDA